jgi:zinc and cadmium transporter
LAVILHKPFGALAIATLMAASGAARSLRTWINLAFACVTPVGAMLFFLGAGPWAHAHPAWLGCALAFCAGTFLCIAGADLLPELQFHRHDRVKLSVALLAGIGMALLIVRLGHAGHDPHHEALRAHRHQLVLQQVRPAAGTPDQCRIARDEDGLNAQGRLA